MKTSKMKYYSFLLSTALYFSCTSRNSSQLDSDFRHNIDVRHQILNIQIHKEEFLTGETIIHFSTIKPTKKIVLDAAEMEFSSVVLDDEVVEFEFNKERQELHIAGQKLISSNKESILKIAFKTGYKNQSDPANIWGSFGKGVRYFRPTMTDKERRFQVWAFGEAESSKYWFPCNDSPSDLRTTEITIKAPKGILTNGIHINTVDHQDGITMTYKEDIPYPVHQTFFVAGDYHNYMQEYEGTVINNYGYPDEKIGTEESVIRLPDMMKFFSDYTGKRYPYSRYSQIFVQDFGGWKPGLATSIITENMIDDKTTHIDFLYGWDLTEGEALASQWFGNYVKPERWEDSWLTKGFSRYFSGLYNQYKNGNTEFLTYQLSPDLAAYLNEWNNGGNTQIVPDSIQDLDAFVNGNTPYAKGPRVLHMLRKELGENIWQTVIKKFLLEYGGKLVCTSDFIDVVNDVSNTPMDWFFEQWVYGVGHPIFEVQQEYDSQNNNLILKVFQQQKKDSLIGNNKIPYFKGTIQIEINDKIEEVQLFAEEENTYTFSMDKKPSLVNFDFEDTWIKESKFEKTTASLLLELEESKDVLHKVTLMQKLRRTALDVDTEPKIVAKIKTALRERALKEDYWRMRLIAISQLSQLFSPASDGKIHLDKETEMVLLKLVKREKSWLKAWAINFLGMSRDKRHSKLYLEGLKDYSDRVVFMSAIALGKTKDKIAFRSLMSLIDKPSWKNQSLISALYGLKELQDPRGYELAIKSLTDSDNPHWNLGTPIWDHRLAAAHTLVAIDKADKGYPAIYAQFQDALKNENLNDIFYNALQVSILGDPRGQVVFEELYKKFSDNKNALKAIEQLENTFNNSIKN